eukprot:TRINITY_DN9847_c0_g1_i1.p1 TRINITY_DN9847_c0_g1~~TRINITY_DN9847_c0_g1_i1.p1  ORF type:complete len:260 (+),score=-21.49 TRINITY_DN9847_c0_g1_i1:365-1144(+)
MIYCIQTIVLTATNIIHSIAISLPHKIQSDTHQNKKILNQLYKYSYQINPNDIFCNRNVINNLLYKCIQHIQKQLKQKRNFEKQYRKYKLLQKIFKKKYYSYLQTFRSDQFQLTKIINKQLFLQKFRSKIKKSLQLQTYISHKFGCQNLKDQILDQMYQFRSLKQFYSLINIYSLQSFNKNTTILKSSNLYLQLNQTVGHGIKNITELSNQIKYQLYEILVTNNIISLFLATYFQIYESKYLNQMTNYLIQTQKGAENK